MNERKKERGKEGRVGEFATGAHIHIQKIKG
jgi:hypothetical protein